MEAIHGEDRGCTRDVQREHHNVSVIGAMLIDLGYGCFEMFGVDTEGRQLDSKEMPVKVA